MIGVVLLASIIFYLVRVQCTIVLYILLFPYTYYLDRPCVWQFTWVLDLWPVHLSLTSLWSFFNFSIFEDSEDRDLKNCVMTQKIKVLKFFSTRLLIFLNMLQHHLSRNLWRLKDKIKRFCINISSLCWFCGLRSVLFYHFASYYISRYARLQWHFGFSILPSNGSFHCLYKGYFQDWANFSFIALIQNAFV